jgi:hypothetical protein
MHRQPANAVPLLERALQLDSKKIQPQIQLTLADALWSRRQSRARALELAEAARASYAGRGHQPGLAKATRWLDEHVG